MNKTNKSNTIFHVFFLILNIFLICFAYWGLFSTFYQQDEWLGLGIVMSDGLLANIVGVSPLLLLTGHGRMLGSLINSVFFWLFPFQTAPIVIWAIAFHSINAILLYILLTKFCKRKIIPCLATVFFSLASVHNQAIAWFASVFTTLPSFTFVLLSFIFLFQFFETHKYRFIVFSQVSCIVAYLFKESSLFIFFLLPVLFLVKKPKSISYIRSGIVWIGLVAYALFVIIVRMDYVAHLGVSAGLFVTNSSSMIVKTIMNGMFYPFISLSQMFIYPKYMFDLSMYVTRIFYGWSVMDNIPNNVPMMIIPDFISLYLSLLVLFFLGMIFFFRKSIRTVLIYGLVFSLTSFLPFVILERSVSYLDSRYFYMGMAGGGVLFAVIIESIYVFLDKKIKIPPFIAALVVFLLASGFIYKNIQFVKREVRFYEIISMERLNFLSDLKKLVGTIPDKPVFYITGNNFGYYGISTLKVPFQQGFGYSLMVVFYQSGKIPGELLSEPFLWGIRNQGYKEIGGKGFGYFYDLEQLKVSILDNRISEDQIVALYYDTDKRELTEITKEIINKLYE